MEPVSKPGTAGTNMEPMEKNLNDYLDAGKRHLRPMLIIFLVVFLIGLALARFLPATFRSTATILIEQQEIPPDLVRSTVTSFATERIQSISQRVMTRTNLLKVMDSTGVYADRRKRETSEAVINRMRDNIKLDMIQGSVSGRGGSAVTGTIAFTLSFEDPNRGIAQKVAQELTTLYLNANLEGRAAAATETLAFLTAEANRLSSHLSSLEEQLADFKTTNRDTLPELQSLNLQLLTATQDQLLATDDGIRMTEERISLLQGELALLDPYGEPTGEFEDSTTANPVLDPAARLRQLRSQLEYLEANYSSDHPDVVRIRRTVENLAAEVGPEHEQSSDNQATLGRLQQELDVARQHYAEDHPDVIRLTKAIESLEKPPAETTNTEGSSANRKDTGADRPTNPSYIIRQQSLEALMRNLRELNIRRDRLLERQKTMEQRLVATPQIERSYRELLRDYQNTEQKYREIKASQLAAQVGQTMEQERKGERFALIEPATLPEDPISPNRPMIVLLGLLLAVGCGFGYVMVAEALDSSVRGPKGVLRVLNVAPMAVIPHQAVAKQILKRRVWKLMLLSVLIAAAITALMLIHFLWKPLDVLWFALLRWFGILIGVDLIQ